MSLIGMSCVIDLSGWTHLCSTFLLNRRKKTKPSCHQRILGEKIDRAHPPFDPLISRSGLPPTDSPCRRWDPKQTPALSPTGVFMSLVTLLSLAVIPLIYYGIVIGWGVAMTQSGRSMNHVGQNISLYPVTPERSSLLESISMLCFLMGDDSSKNFYWNAVTTATLISSWCRLLGTNSVESIYSKWQRDGQREREGDEAMFIN